MLLEFLGVLGPLFLRPDVLPILGMSVQKVEYDRLSVHRNFLKFGIHPLLGKLGNVQDIAHHFLENLVPDGDVAASPTAVPCSDLCTVFPLCTLATEILAALSAFDESRKFIEPAPVGISGFVLVKLSPCVSALLRPPVRLGCGIPFLLQNRSVKEMEFQSVLGDYSYPLDFFGENISVKFIRTKDIGAYGFQCLFGDGLRGAVFRALVALRPTYPDVINLIGIFPLAFSAPSVAFPTDAAFDFACEAGCIDAPVRQSAKLPAPFPFLLHCLVGFHRYDGFVRVLHKILRKFPAVDSGFSRYRIGNIFLLEKQVARVGDVAQNLADGGIAEVHSLVGFHAHFFKLLFRGLR